MGAILLGLLGTVFLGSLIIDGGDDTESSDETTENENENSEPQTIQTTILGYDGSERLNGTNGNDFVEGFQDGEAPESIHLYQGDDVAVIDFESGIRISGGKGEDVLEAMDPGHTLFGGYDNDTLTGANGSTIFGGHGHDVLTLKSYAAWLPEDLDQIGQAELRGGNGRDEFHIHDLSVPFGATDEHAPEIYGGRDNDQFYFDIQARSESPAVYDVEHTEKTIATIKDYNPNPTILDPNHEQINIQLDLTEYRGEGEIDVEVAMEQEKLSEESYKSVLSIVLTYPDSPDSENENAASDDNEDNNKYTYFINIMSRFEFSLDSYRTINVTTLRNV